MYALMGSLTGLSLQFSLGLIPVHRVAYSMFTQAVAVTIQHVRVMQ